MASVECNTKLTLVLCRPIDNVRVCIKKLSFYYFFRPSNYKLNESYHNS